MGTVDVVKGIIKKLKNKYGTRYKYYLTGSYARNEKDFQDYDIAIHDLENNNMAWESLLKSFYNKKEKDGRPIDAQISQYIPEVKKMNGKELYKNRDKIVKRYFYSSKKLKNWKYILYNNINGNLWEKQIMLVKPKHRAMGLDKIKRVYLEL